MRKYVLLPVAALVLLIQAHRPERANPPVAAARTIEASLEVPSEVRALLNRSCTDCHSHRTAWPWYSQVAPVSWILASHVSEGRKHLNFSDWPGSHKPQALLEEICEEVEQGGMPLAGYALLHPSAKLSPAERGVICTWSKSAAPRLAP